MAGAAAPSTSPITVTVQAVAPLGIWTWNLRFSTCAICRVDLDCIPPAAGAADDVDDAGDAEGASDPRAASSTCIVHVGACTHCFHRTCIQQWLRIRRVCPMCNAEWHLEHVHTGDTEVASAQVPPFQHAPPHPL